MEAPTRRLSRTEANFKSEIPKFNPLISSLKRAASLARSNLLAGTPLRLEESLSASPAFCRIQEFGYKDKRACIGADLAYNARNRQAKERYFNATFLKHGTESVSDPESSVVPNPMLTGI